MITQSQLKDLRKKIDGVVGEWSDQVVKQTMLTDPKVLKRFIGDYVSPGEEFTTDQLTVVMESEYGKVNGQKLSVTMTQLVEQGFLKEVGKAKNRKIYIHRSKIRKG